MTGDTFTAGRLSRFWRAFTRPSRQDLRAGTAEESRLLAEVEALTAALDDREAMIRRLRLDVEALNGQIRIGQLAVQQLTDVVERDRLRVQAETAEYAARITGPRRDH